MLRTYIFQEIFEKDIWKDGNNSEHVKIIKIIIIIILEKMKILEYYTER